MSDMTRKELEELKARHPEFQWEYGAHVTGYPRNIASWPELCDEPADGVSWFTDIDELENYGVGLEDEGFNVKYLRRLVTPAAEEWREPE